MARIHYVEPGSSPQADEVYEQLKAMGRPVLNLYRALANQPEALRAFLGMSRYVRGGSSLDPALREAVILATAQELGSHYEVAHHSQGVDFDALDERGRCAVEYARSTARDRSSNDAVFQRLEAHFSTAEIVDLVVTVAWYHLCAVILGSLAVDFER